TKASAAKPDLSAKPYDSTENFVENKPAKYIGQELYLKGLSESLREYGYAGFFIDYQIAAKSSLEKSNIYKCCNSYNANYDSLAGRYFKVLAVFAHPDADKNDFLYGKKYYLKLEEKNTKDILYYEYDAQYEFNFPFIVLGHFEYIKKKMKGTNFVFCDKVLESAPKDIVTGKDITKAPGQKWEFIDLTIEEKYYNLSAIVENSRGERITVSSSDIYGPDHKGRSYNDREVATYTTKFGATIFNTILKNSVKVGMTKEMCTLSWGQPNKINQTVVAGGKSEQWVYKDNYLYFANGVLTTIQ
ncbi:MAG: hypothetical protein ACHP6H_04890, partial [Legionellales bacterium]